MLSGGCDFVNTVELQVCHRDLCGRIFVHPCPKLMQACMHAELILRKLESRCTHLIAKMISLGMAIIPRKRGGSAWSMLVV